MKMNTSTEKETVKFGQKIGATLKPGDIVCLYGDLGAGKTTLVKGIAKGLGVKKNIVSPTFSLMNIQEIEEKQKASQKIKIVHIDTYRLNDEQELIDIGALDYLGSPDAICLVEWPEKIKEILRNKKTIAITIEHKNKETRTIAVA